MHYPPLGPLARSSIWEYLFPKLELSNDSPLDIADLLNHVNELASEQMNGRQIRGPLLMARQLPKFKKIPLAYKHLKNVIEVNGQLDK